MPLNSGAAGRAGAARPVPSSTTKPRNTAHNGIRNQERTNSLRDRHTTAHLRVRRTTALESGCGEFRYAAGVKGAGASGVNVPRFRRRSRRKLQKIPLNALVGADSTRIDSGHPESVAGVIESAAFP